MRFWQNEKGGDGMEDKKKTVPIHFKYLLTVDEMAAYTGIGTDKIRYLIKEHMNSSNNFTIMVGSKYLIHRKKFEKFLDETTSL